MSTKSNLLEILSGAKAQSWPFIEAQRILDKINNKLPQKGYVLFETGYGPSGLPHIGTFAEVARTTMVRNAFQKISDMPTRLFCFSDDMDGLRKVPSNVPNQELVAQYIDRPLTDIPDPFGEAKSYGDYMNQKLKSFLDTFGFEYEFQSATDWYKSGKFDHMMIRVLEKYQDIMGIMLPTLRDERRKTYSPFLPICPKTGKVLQVSIIETNLVKNTIAYLDGDEKIEVPVTGGHCKLQWKPDFGMRWAALGVDYEMYGKDHMPNAEIYSRLCEALDGVKPVQFFYELFLDETGQKISKSKGNSISVDDWLRYAPLESIALFMYNSPAKAKRLYFDVIPKCVDEYLIFVEKYHQNQNIAEQINSPVYHIHNGNVPKIETYGITFSLLLNLACACNPENKEVLWGFITQYAPEANSLSAPFLDHLVNYAIIYYNDFIKAKKTYLDPTEKHLEILNRTLVSLENMDENYTGEEIQNVIYSIGMESGYENLRLFFSDLYQILLGQKEGPRLGSFIKLYGVGETRQLILRIINQFTKK
jgi:lysyl-tRNA synthetase class 1